VPPASRQTENTIAIALCVFIFIGLTFLSCELLVRSPPAMARLLQVWNGGLEQIIGTQILRNLGVHLLEISRIRVGLRQDVGILGGHFTSRYCPFPTRRYLSMRWSASLWGSPLRVQPNVLIKVNGIHDKRVSFPVSEGVTLTGIFGRKFLLGSGPPVEKKFVACNLRKSPRRRSTFCSSLETAQCRSYSRLEPSSGTDR